MKLLIVTQKVDINDPILGFFHKWIEELAKKFEKVTVICLEKKEYNLPSNVSVNSLGKEKFENSNIENSLKIKNSKLKIFRRINYIFRFYYLIWKIRRDYDAVFVHMNQEYIILAGFLWRVMRKKIYFWRNHPEGNLLTYIAVWLSNKVFCTSKASFTAKFKKTSLMPVGVDIERFKDGKIERLEEKKNKILFLGRMDPIKRPELLIEALDILNKKGAHFICNFYGDPTLGNEIYFNSLKEKTREFKLENKINFYKGVANHQTPAIYNEHDIFVNLTPSGSFDKTVLEAAVSGCIPLVNNLSLRGEIDSKLIIEYDTPKNIADSISKILNLPSEEKEILRTSLCKYVKKNHSLDILMEKLSIIIKNND